MVVFSNKTTRLEAYFVVGTHRDTNSALKTATKAHRCWHHDYTALRASDCVSPALLAL